MVAVNGKPRIRIITSPPRDKNACASELLPETILKFNYCIGIIFNYMVIHTTGKGNKGIVTTLPLAMSRAAQ